jgi:tetratricopeptide (TPR) repeat protein
MKIAFVFFVFLSFLSILFCAEDMFLLKIEKLIDSNYYPKAIMLCHSNSGNYVQSSRFWKDFGKASFLNGEFKESIKCYKKALKINQKKEDILYGLAEAYLLNGQKDSASVYIRKYDEITNHSAKSKILFSELAWTTNEIDVAFEFCNQAIKQDSLLGEAWFLKGVFQTYQDDIPQNNVSISSILSNLIKGKNLNPNLMNDFDLICLNLAHDSLNLSVENQELIFSNLKNKQYYYLCLTLELAQGTTEEQTNLESYLHFYKQKNPNDPLNYTIAAIIAELNNKTDSRTEINSKLKIAFEKYSNMFTLNQSKPSELDFIDYDVICTDLNKITSDISQLSKGHILYPNNSIITTRLVIAYWKTSQFQLAQNVINSEFISLTDDNQYKGLSKYLNKEPINDVNSKLFEQILSNNPNLQQLAYRLGNYYYFNGNYIKALTSYKKAYHLFKENNYNSSISIFDKSFTLNCMGDCSYRMNNFAEALKYYTEYDNLFSSEEIEYSDTEQNKPDYQVKFTEGCELVSFYYSPTISENQTDVTMTAPAPADTSMAPAPAPEAPSDDCSNRIKLLQSFVGSDVLQPILNEDGSIVCSINFTYYLYYYKTFVITNPNRVKVWIYRINLDSNTDETNQPKQIVYSKNLWEIDFNSQSQRTLEIIEYDKDGNILNSYSFDAKDVKWTSVVPESIGESVYQFMQKQYNKKTAKK